MSAKQFLTVMTVALSPMQGWAADFLDDNQGLRKFLFDEPLSPLHLGIGVTPVGITKGKTYFDVSFFQAHLITEFLDWELLGLSVGFVSARSSQADSRHFVVRSSPKFRLLDSLSMGVIGGYELVTFPEIQSSLFRDRWKTPQEPFSSRGWVYGLAMAVSFPLGETIFRVTPSYRIQTYPHKEVTGGWRYVFHDELLQTPAGEELLKADAILAVELGILI